MRRVVRFSIFKMALAALERVFRNIVTLIKIFWLPWLVSTVLLVAIEVFWFEQFDHKIAPDVVLDIAWSPFIAAIGVWVLRYSFAKQEMAWRSVLDFSHVTWLVAGVYATWFVCSALIEQGIAYAQDKWIFWNAVQVTTFHRWNIVTAWDIVPFVAVKLLLMCLVALALFGMIAIAVRDGKLDWAENWRLIRLCPLRLFAYVMLIGAICEALRQGQVRVEAFLGLTSAGAAGYYDWRDMVLPLFADHLRYLPVLFLIVTIQLMALAEVYLQLTKWRDGLGSTVPAAD